MTIPRGPATTLTVYDGNRVDLVLEAFLKAMAVELDFDIVSVIQGYNPDNFDTSAGSHSFGVADLPANDAARKLRVIGKLGGWGWLRHELPGKWAPHIHFGVRNHPGLAEVAKRQQADFDANPPRNGLADHSTDFAVLAYRPNNPVEFVYPPVKEIIVPEPTQIQVARSHLAKSIHQGKEAIAALRDADPAREFARAQRDDIRESVDELEAILERLPKR